MSVYGIISKIQINKFKNFKIILISNKNIVIEESIL